MLLFEAELAVRRCKAPDAEGQLPGLRTVVLAVLGPTVSFAWLITTVAWCYALHQPLRDPAVTFPQISELGAGPASARMLYRFGFGSASALFFATVLLQQELCLPLLPGGRLNDEGERFTNSGIAVALGIGTQGLFVLETSMSMQTGLHFVGTGLFFLASMNLMTSAERLYFFSEAVAEDEEGVASTSLQLAECTLLTSSPMLQQLAWFRHFVLMKAPMALFVIPICYQLFMRVGASESNAAGSSGVGSALETGDSVEAHSLLSGALNGKRGSVVGTQGDRVRVDFGRPHGEKALRPTNLKRIDQGASAAIRNAMGLAQWLLILDFAVIFASYCPEIVAAALIPVPGSEGV